MFEGFVSCPHDGMGKDVGVVLLAVLTVVGKSILKVVLAVHTVVGENI